MAAAWGIDPLFMVVGSQTFPKNVSEYEYLGGIKGEPIPVVKGKTTNLLLPANAEFMIEGVIKPNSVRSEGPFGEFPGYYGRPEAGCPLVEITAVHYRNDPILTNALMADYPSCEQSGFFSVIPSRTTRSTPSESLAQNVASASGNRGGESIMIQSNSLPRELNRSAVRLDCISSSGFSGAIPAGSSDKPHPSSL